MTFCTTKTDRGNYIIDFPLASDSVDSGEVKSLAKKHVTFSHTKRGKPNEKRFKLEEFKRESAHVRLLLFRACTLSVHQRKNRKMEETERRDDNEEEERGKEGLVLFLPHETLVKVFAMIDCDNSKTISGVEFLTALRNNTGGVSEILDSALRREEGGKKKKEKKTKFGTGDENERKFELGSKIIAKISGVGEEGIGLSEFVEAFRVVAANEDDDENDDGDDEEEIGDAQYRRRRRRNNGATSNSGGESEMDEDSFASSPRSPAGGEEWSSKVDPVRAAILEKREHVEELKRVKRMTALVAEACKSLVRKNLKKKERMGRRKEGLKRFIPRVKNLKNFTSSDRNNNNNNNNNNNSASESESDSESEDSESNPHQKSYSKATLSMAPGKEKGGMTREKKMRKLLKQKMSPEMRALNDELHINAHVLLDVFKDLNYSGTGLVIVDGFLHVYERNDAFRQELRNARNDKSSHSSFEQDMARTATEMGGRRRESVDIVSFFSYFCRAKSTLRPKLPPLPEIPMNDGMVSPGKASVEGPSRQRRNVLEAKIGIGSGAHAASRREDGFDGASVNSVSTNDSTKEGIAQHLKLTPMKSPKRLTSAMKKMKVRKDEEEEDKNASARQRLNFDHPSSRESGKEGITLEHLDSNASKNTEKNYRILSMVLDEDDRINEIEDEDDESHIDEEANLRGLEMEALIHVLSMREMNKVHR